MSMIPLRYLVLSCVEETLGGRLGLAGKYARMATEQERTRKNSTSIRT